MAKSGINIELPKFQIDKLNRDLNAYAKTKDNQIANEIERTLYNILSDAKREVGRISSRLLTSGFVQFFRRKLSGTVFFNANYAPFVEFGTGKNVFRGSNFNFTADIRQYASQFKRGGKRNPNLKARPYLFPAFVDNTKKLTERIQKLLNKK